MIMTQVGKRVWSTSGQSSDEKIGEEPVLGSSQPSSPRLGARASICNSCQGKLRHSFLPVLTPNASETPLMPLFLSPHTSNPSVNPPSFTLRTQPLSPTSHYLCLLLRGLDHHHCRSLLSILPVFALAPHGQGTLHKKKAGQAALLLKALNTSRLPRGRSLPWPSAPRSHHITLLASSP